MCTLTDTVKQCRVGSGNIMHQKPDWQTPVALFVLLLIYGKLITNYDHCAF